MQELQGLLGVGEPKATWKSTAFGCMIFGIISSFLSLVIPNTTHAQQRVKYFSMFENRKLGPILMESTFYLYDPSDTTNAGTAFVLAHVLNNDAFSMRIDSIFYKNKKEKIFRFQRFTYCEILLTAAHVFKSIKGDYANIVLRKKRGNDYDTFDLPIKIREFGKPLWTQVNDDVDVAALAVLLPHDAVYTILTDDHLIFGEKLNIIGLNAGDEMSCVGFPHNTPSDDKYFPILRSGKYASYRRESNSNAKSFLFDFRIYPGNSGGPVFTDLKVVIDQNHQPVYTAAAMLGIVTKRLRAIDARNSIEVAEVISAEYVYKAILSVSYIPSSLYIKSYDENRVD